MNDRGLKCLTTLAVIIISGGRACLGASYTISDLGLPNAPSVAFGVSSNGLVTGFYGASNEEHAFLYSSGTITDIGTLPNPTGGNYSASIGYSVNSSGHVAGESFDVSQYPGHSFIHSNGQMADLGTMGGIGSYASAINNAGQVAGFFISANQTRHAVLYSNNQVTDLGTLGGSSSEARAINANGHVAGISSLSGDTTSNVFIYSDGTMHDLGFSAVVAGINASDQLTGSIYDSNNIYHAFIYSNGTITNLGMPGVSPSFGYGINASGDAVGEFFLSDNFTNHAFIYSDGTMTDLNSLIAPSSGWTLSSANGINDAGQIVGYGTNSQGAIRAFLLTPSASPSGTTPTPEPATAAALLLTAPLLFRRRRRSV